MPKVAGIDYDLQLAILNVLQLYYPSFTGVMSDSCGAIDLFWTKMGAREIAANLAYLEEMKQVKVSWEYTGSVHLPMAAKITKPGIDRLIKQRNG